MGKFFQRLKCKIRGHNWIISPYDDSAYCDDCGFEVEHYFDVDHWDIWGLKQKWAYHKNSLLWELSRLKKCPKCGERNHKHEKDCENDVPF